MKIGIDKIGSNARPYVIAEAGVNFLGDLDLAKAFIDEAAAAGADAIKFQTHVRDAEMSESGMEDLGMEDLYRRMAAHSLTIEEHEILKARCDEQDITFLSTPFSVEGVKLLSDIGVPALKIGSGELTDYHILREGAECGVPMLISTGMHEMDTVERAASFVRQYTDDIAFFYCVSEYPTPIENVNLDLLGQMKEKLDVPIGFSDHTLGIQASVIAMARGADIIEKHFTIDRRLPGGDQEVSIEPEELSELTDYAQAIVNTSGSEKSPTNEEVDLAEWARHSVVSTREIDEGETIDESMITTKRPGTGIPATEFYDVIGKVVTEKTPQDAVIKSKHFD